MEIKDQTENKDAIQITIITNGKNTSDLISNLELNILTNKEARERFGLMVENLLELSDKKA